MGNRRSFRASGRKGEYLWKQNATCKVCSEQRTFNRRPSDPRRRQKGHIKHLHCYFCNRVTAHVQTGGA